MWSLIVYTEEWGREGEGGGYNPRDER